MLIAFRNQNHLSVARVPNDRKLQRNCARCSHCSAVLGNGVRSRQVNQT